jgi:DNA polymerase
VTDPHLIDHLRLLEELGVDGFTRDPVWRQRGVSSPESAGTPAEDAVPRTEPDLAVPPGHEAWRGESGAPQRTTADSPAAGERRAHAAPAAQSGRDAAAAGRRARGDRDLAGGVPAMAASLFTEAEPALPEAPADPAASLAAIRADLGDCTRCKLHTLGRTQIVFGVGNPRAALMFVGEAPGADEDEQGIPFVGRAGQLLTRIIEAIGLGREDVYIANVIKCRPPGNRNPEPDEVATCQPFLVRQIDAIRPKVIVALGTFAARALVGGNAPISRLRGRVFACRGAQVVPTFHPAYLLRNPAAKRDTWEDMKKVRRLLAGDPVD